MSGMPEGVFCSSCGYRNRQAFAFCTKCGLPNPETVGLSPSDPPPAMAPNLEAPPAYNDSMGAMGGVTAPSAPLEGPTSVRSEVDWSSPEKPTTNNSSIPYAPAPPASFTSLPASPASTTNSVATRTTEVPLRDGDNIPAPDRIWGCFHRPQWGCEAWVLWFFAALVGVGCMVGMWAVWVNQAIAGGRTFKAVCTSSVGSSSEMDNHICLFAFGQFSYGIVAFGQFAVGLIAIGQLSVGVLFGVGMLCGGSGITIAMLTVSLFPYASMLGVGVYRCYRSLLGINVFDPLLTGGNAVSLGCRKRGEVPVVFGVRRRF